MSKSCFNHVKQRKTERGWAKTSLSRGGFKRLKIACKRPYCGRLSTLKNCLHDYLVSFPSFHFLFRELKTHKIAFCNRVSAILYFCDLNVLYNPRKIMLMVECGWLLGGILCQGLANGCKNARWLNMLRVPFLVQGCLPEINIETNGTYICFVNDAGRALDLRLACQNLGLPDPKWMSWKLFELSIV